MYPLILQPVYVFVIYYFLALIFVVALLITSYSYIGDPIDCYEPQEFEDQWVEYMDNVCWVSLRSADNS